MSDDDFSERVKLELARRVAYLCSNCGAATSGPHTDPTKSVRIGEAAHICGKEKDAKRHDPSMTSEERSAIDNGIWLCRNCHKQIDTDEQRFTVELLRLWKAKAELTAGDQLGKPKELLDQQHGSRHGPLVASYNQSGGQTALQIVNNAPPARRLGGRIMPASYVTLIRAKDIEPPRVEVCSDHPETLQFGWDITEALLQLGLMKQKRGLDRLINGSISRIMVESMASDTDDPLWYFAEWLIGEGFVVDYKNGCRSNRIIVPQQ